MALFLLPRLDGRVFAMKTAPAIQSISSGSFHIKQRPKEAHEFLHGLLEGMNDWVEPVSSL
jgi:hypothetical protein